MTTSHACRRMRAAGSPLLALRKAHERSLRGSLSRPVLRSSASRFEAPSIALKMAAPGATSGSFVEDRHFGRLVGRVASIVAADLIRSSYLSRCTSSAFRVAG